MKRSSKRGSGALRAPGCVVIHHDVGVDVAVAGVAETGQRQAMLLLQPRGEGEQILQTAAGNDDVLVQLGQAGVAQGEGKFAAQFPDVLAFGFAEAGFDEQGVMPAHNFFKRCDFLADGMFLAVEFYDEMGAAAA